MKSIPKMKNRKSEAAAKILKNSSVIYMHKFHKKADELYQYCLENEVLEAVKENGAELPCSRAVFFSIGNPSSRAVVLTGTGETVEDAWKNAVQKTEQFLKNRSFDISYLKVDFVDQAQWFPLENINGILEKSKKSFWRCGLSFDNEFQNAFLEEELNMRRLVRYDRNGISLQRINGYLREKNRPQMFRLPDQVLVFTCTAVFSDEQNVIHELYNEGYGYGRRRIEKVDRELLEHILSTAGEQLAQMVKPNGEFQYGYFADLNERIPTYNIVRHVAAVWALLMKYTREPQKALKEKIDAAVEYAIQNAMVEHGEATYVVERNAGEIKLGANAVAIITLLTYIEVMKDEKYLPLIKRLGEGILTCQNPDGEYWHILSYPGFERKEKYRIVYYDGEATFALAKLYGFTKEEKWIQAAQRAISHFIEADYVKYRDHWVAYALNEVTKYVPEERYFAFAVKNVEKNILFMYKRDTSYHTFQEMLIASFETIQRAKKLCPDLKALKTFDEKWMITAIYYRAQHMLAGYLYPEYAMYMKNPKPFIGSFCVRHHHFRVRIDDIEHFMGGYYHMLRNFDELEAERLHFGIEPDDYMELQEEYLNREQKSAGKGGNGNV